MDERNNRGLLHRLIFGRGGPVPESKPMTREQQTAWIIGAMIVLAFLGWRYIETKDDPCARLLGSSDLSCRASMAAERLNRRY